MAPWSAGHTAEYFTRMMAGLGEELGFDIDTRQWANSTHELAIEVRAESAGMRHYCYEGDVR